MVYSRATFVALRWKGFMPIYEYRCLQCGERSEELQRVNEPPLRTCEQCGGELKKLLSAPAFQFKGSGWYVTDYARKSGSEEKSEGESKKSSDDGGESKSDSKKTKAKASGSEAKDKESSGGSKE